MAGRDGRQPNAFLRGVLEFLKEILGSLARDAARLLLAFGIGTGVSALACLYYGAPLILSLLGGFIVLGIAVIFLMDSSIF